jgi:hypothetical protein
MSIIKKSIKSLLILLASLSCNNPKNNFSSKLDSRCTPIIDHFFNMIESKNYEKALDTLLLSNENFDLKDSSTLDLKSKFYAINRLSGPFRGKELLKKRSINDAIAVYSYLVKYDKKFYRFVFVFYNNEISTKIYKFQFNDSIEEEVEESLKLYTL